MIAKYEKTRFSLDPEVDLRAGDEVAFYRRGPEAGDVYESLGTCKCIIAREWLYEEEGEEGERVEEIAIDFSWSGQDREKQRAIEEFMRTVPLLRVNPWGAKGLRECTPRDFVIAYVSLPVSKAQSLLSGESSSLCVFGTRDGIPHVLLYAPALGQWLRMSSATARWIPMPTSELPFDFTSCRHCVRSDPLRQQECYRCIQLVRPAYSGWSDTRPGDWNWWTWCSFFFLKPIVNVFFNEEWEKALGRKRTASKISESLSHLWFLPDDEILVGIVVGAAGTRGDYAMHNDLELARVSERLGLSHLDNTRPDDARRIRTILGLAIEPPFAQRLTFRVYQDLERRRPTSVEVPIALLICKSDVWMRIVRSQSVARAGPIVVDLLRTGVTERAMMMTLELMLFDCMEETNLKAWMRLSASSKEDADTFASVADLCDLWDVSGFDLYVLFHVLRNSSYEVFGDMMNFMSGALPALKGRSLIEQPFLMEMDPLVPYILHGLHCGLLTVERARRAKRPRISSPSVLTFIGAEASYRFTEDVCLAAARSLDVNLSVASPAVWTYAMNVQLECGGDPMTAAQAVLANMQRAPDYYDRLALLRERLKARPGSQTFQWDGRSMHDN
jgi:hypothetical protein